MARQWRSPLPDLVGLVDFAAGAGSRTDPAAVVRPEAVVARMLDAMGNEKDLGADGFGSGTDKLDALGRRTLTQRDVNGNPIQIESADGTVADIAYDRRGNIIGVTAAVGHSEERTMEMEYQDATGLVSRFVDETGETLFERDGSGNLLGSTNAAGGQRAMAYDERGLLLSETDQEGNTTEFSYDGLGNLETITDPAGTILRLSRDGAGNIIAITEAEGTPAERTSRLRYDGLNRVLAAEDASGQTATFTYDEAGNLVERIDRAGRALGLTYDGMNRVVGVSHPLYGDWGFAYDNNGRMTEWTDPMGGVHRGQYDVAGRLLQVDDASGNQTQYTYDALNRPLGLVGPGGNETRFERDRLGRIIARANPLGQRVQYRYDSQDNLVQRVNARGQTIDYTYDAIGRLVRVETPDDTIDWTYDGEGNLLAVEDSDSRVVYSYDALSRITQVSTEDKGHQPEVVLTHSYNPLGNRIGLADSEGGQITYGYDALNRMTAVTAPSAAAVALEYNDSGFPTRLDFPNGVEATYTYDSLSRVMQLRHGADGTDPLLDLHYAYNGIGDFASVSDGDQAQVFTYDALEQLEAAGTTGTPETYSYDQAGNRRSSHLSENYTHDGANRLLDDDDFTYTYDADGNLTAKTAKVGGATTTYTYDALGKLVQIDLPDDGKVTYRYDGLGRRIEKVVNQQTSRYVYDDKQLLLEYDGNNQLVARYIYGQLVDQLLLIERGGQVYSVHADHLGSIRQISDGSGAAVNRYAYDAFGNFVLHQEAVANPFGFTGREWDSESGLYFFRARYYDPQAGRFVSEDPLGLDSGDTNGYRYVFNSPVNGVDSEGLAGPAGAAVGAVLGGLFNGLSAALDPDKDWGDVALATAVGAGAGALGGAVCNPVLAGALVGAATEVGNSAVEALVDPDPCRPFFSLDTAGRVVLSGALGALGGRLGQSVARGAQASANGTALATALRRPESGQLLSRSLDDVANIVSQNGDDAARQLLAQARIRASGGLENLSQADQSRAMRLLGEAVDATADAIRRRGQLEGLARGGVAGKGVKFVAGRLVASGCDCD